MRISELNTSYPLPDGRSSKSSGALARNIELYIVAPPPSIAPDSGTGPCGGAMLALYTNVEFEIYRSVPFLLKIAQPPA